MSSNLLTNAIRSAALADEPPVAPGEISSSSPLTPRSAAVPQPDCSRRPSPSRGEGNGGRRLAAGVFIAASILSFSSIAGEHAEIPQGVKRILFLGDSITYSGQYISYFEAYFLTRTPDRKLEYINVGLPSETVSGLSEDGHAGGKFPRPDVHERLARVLEKTRPDLVFANYGMNCGIYQPLADERFSKFKDGMTRLHDAVIKAGAKIVHVTPPTYDGVTGKNPHYGAVLDRYAEWLIGQREKGWDVADLHAPMNRFLAEGREKDPKFALAGDGVHPGELGHWIMARQMLLHLGAKDLADVNDGKALLAPHPKAGEILTLIARRQGLVRDAWLTETKHTRPGIGAGMPLAEADAKAAEFAKQIGALFAAK